jgi:hypothetical protein
MIGRRQSLVLVSIVLVSLSAPGCGSSASPQTVTATKAAATARSASPAADTTSETPAYKPPRHVMHGLGFDSPTGNIRCATFTGDPQMLGCKTLNNHRGIILETTSAAYEDGNQTAPRNPTLPYGWRWTTQYFICWSKVTEVLCRSQYSRQGFSINRDGIKYWVWNRPLKYFSYGGGSGEGGEIQGGTGYDVYCVDGTISHSGGIQGACSWHGGVAGP